MRNAYGFILRLYPEGHKAIFASEMLATFEQAAADCRKQGIAASFYFASRELAGLAGSLPMEWFARLTSGDNYLATQGSPTTISALPVDIAEVQTRIQSLIRAMEHAIAHHDFPKARFYSDEERVMQVQLQQLLNH